MKYLVATRETQGKRDNDFCFVPEGEPVSPMGFECSREAVDGPCGCRRSLSGTTTLTATTTFRVVEDPGMTNEKLFDIFYKGLENGGWFTGLGETDRLGWAASLVGEACDAVSGLPAWSVVERRGAKYHVRKSKAK